MLLAEIVALLGCTELLALDQAGGTEIAGCFAADLMSDVLAFCGHGRPPRHRADQRAVGAHGRRRRRAGHPLRQRQAARARRCWPWPAQRGLPLLSTTLTMFEACGRLHAGRPARLHQATERSDGRDRDRSTPRRSGSAGATSSTGARSPPASRRSCKELGIPPDVIRRLSIANFEAEMNVIMYADEAELELPGPARRGAGRGGRPRSGDPGPRAGHDRRATRRPPPRCARAASAPGSACPTSRATRTSSGSSRPPGSARPSPTPSDSPDVPEGGPLPDASTRSSSTPQRCVGCVDCCKACPTGAIRVRDGCAVADARAVHRLRRLHPLVPARGGPRGDLHLRGPEALQVHGRHALADPLRPVRQGRAAGPGAAGPSQPRLRRRLRPVGDVRDARQRHRRLPLGVPRSLAQDLGDLLRPSSA